MYKKIVSSIILVASIMTIIFTTSALAQSQYGTTPYNVKDWLSGDNKYVDYDFGSWRPNDDAWLKAEVYGDAGKSGYCYAKAGSKTAYDSGIYAIVEISG